MAGRVGKAFALAIAGTLFTSFWIAALPGRVPRAGRLLRTSARGEPQFNVTSSFIAHWASAWHDYTALHDSPLGAMLADLVHALHRHQNPADCATARYLIFEYNTPLGFGAQVRHILSAFYAALQADRVLVLSERLPFYWAKGCADADHNRRFTCHFRKLSESCPFSRVDQLINDGRIHEFNANHSSSHAFARSNAARCTSCALRFSKKDMGRHFSHFLHGFRHQHDFAQQVQRLLPSASPLDLRPQAHARRLWLSAAAFYVTRPNRRVAARVQSGVERALSASGSPGAARLVGMPVRASDKCFGSRHPGPGEMTCVPLNESADAVMRLVLMQPELTHVIVTSEDARAIGERTVREAFARFPFLAPPRVVRYRDDVRPGTGAASRVIAKLRKAPAQLLDSILVVLHLQALAEFHVLTPRSTFHSLIAALANTTPGKRRHVTLPLGTWRDLNNSISSQIVR